MVSTKKIQQVLSLFLSFFLSSFLPLHVVPLKRSRLIALTAQRNRIQIYIQIYTKRPNLSPPQTSQSILIQSLTFQKKKSRTHQSRRILRDCLLFATDNFHSVRAWSIHGLRIGQESPNHHQGSSNSIIFPTLRPTCPTGGFPHSHSHSHHCLHLRLRLPFFVFSPPVGVSGLTGGRSEKQKKRKMKTKERRRGKSREKQKKLNE